MISVEGQHKDDHCVLNSAVCDVINFDLQRDNLNDSVVRETTLIVVHFLVQTLDRTISC